MDNSIPKAPPTILPLPPAASRPLWSVMIPVYNCGRFLGATLESVLQQQLPTHQMQITVVDDASTDTDVAALVQQIGQGRISYFRQPENVGSLRNFETCLNLAQGTYVHLLHGDDLVKPGYYSNIEALFAQYPEAGAAFCRYSCINEQGDVLYDKKKERQTDGLLANWLETISIHQRIQYAAITVRREVYEKLGSFYGVTYGEDWEMWVRIARYYPVAYTPDVLASYRTHSNSISGNKYTTGAHLQDLFQTMQLIQNHLPDHLKKRVLHKSRKYYAAYGIKIAGRLWRQFQSRQIVDAQVRQVLQLNRGPQTYLKLLNLYFKLAFKTA